ncbi:MAG: ABC transporter ATP-binding protein [Candidatus Contendobacter odensis]|uniref:ABC transporter ATP-binding protein n=1 Tax=Candidatus Contendibacter odensensis TaxID=1400860 RepID=A0A2G6PF37_9GAMM|nr:MAG: ABC transporter ATP-binding protein [Candidatus Contendobacter odensis]
MTPFLKLNDVDLAYPPRKVIENLSLQLESADIGCLLGPSGCGKTTVLRAIAGFEPLQRGSIRLEGVELSRYGWSLPTEQRRIGMMFQDLALFPHLSIADNIAFGLRNWKAAERKSRVRELLRLVGLEEYVQHYPHQVSGGQQQRVALARALAPRPKLLLLDEPFSSLDATLREGLAREVRAILLREGVGGLLVSHDQFEAFAFADQIGVLHGGHLLQWGSAYNLYHQPVSRFVASFIGQGVFLSGQVSAPGKVCTEFGEIVGFLPPDCKLGDQVDIFVRPDDVLHDDASPVKVEVVERTFRGAEFLYTLRLPTDTHVLCLASSHHNHALGQHIGIRLSINDLVVFRRE